MTISPDVAAESTRTPRSQRLRHYAMTPPTFFAVEYAINPWMDTSTAVDVDLAIAQWENLRDTYRRLGHTVDLVEPVPGLPDMVYAANAGLIINGSAIVARFKHPERHGESAAYAAWMDRLGHKPVPTRHVNEGQGDLLVVGSTILAGTGFRTHPQAHAEVAAITGMPVVSLELIDPRFYHLDTALTVLDDTTIAYYPPAFTDAARARLGALFPDAIEVASTDAYVLGLNAVSDGKHVVHPAQATTFAEQLYQAGFHPIGVDLSELLKGGGSVKCCTLEVFS
ncbi:arginine deiminase family protein [Mycobacterium sp. CVI_P3]|uniref:Arginine deiminase family protein n=1 Tax=Mycobacterium pinniadriaticum TaxID=2994102 RepID=A0ABT3SNA0_9MYCO|nr:dimethylargininase [Mycobacterium pinniadriaticum]MCX2934584.1 arginine deiminase family protein [Mycobacterium pinniadriaticum]MCX2941014.1 arginine deiminase family protein [Mycobacterium pinniadriaticum]